MKNSAKFRESKDITPRGETGYNEGQKNIHRHRKEVRYCSQETEMLKMQSHQAMIVVLDAQQGGTSIEACDIIDY